MEKVVLGNTNVPYIQLPHTRLTMHCILIVYLTNRASLEVAKLTRLHLVMSQVQFALAPYACSQLPVRNCMLQKAILRSDSALVVVTFWLNS